MFAELISFSRLTPELKPLLTIAINPRANVNLPNITRAVLGIAQSRRNTRSIFFLFRKGGDYWARTGKIQRSAIGPETRSVFQPIAVDGGSQTYGFSPFTSLSETLERGEAIQKMPEGPEKQAARKSLRESDLSPTRIFVGKDKE